MNEWKRYYAGSMSEGALFYLFYNEYLQLCRAVVPKAEGTAKAEAYKRRLTTERIMNDEC